MIIGILGGSFNPVHTGHLNIAEAALKGLKLDRMYLMPAGVPPHKDVKDFPDRFLRLEMVRIAVAGVPGLEALDYEISRDEKCYTYETISALKEKHPEDEIYFVIGEDSLDLFDTWMHPEIICSNAIIAVASRSDMAKGELLDIKLSELSRKYDSSFVRIECPDTPVSSTEIRKSISEGKERSKYLPEEVYTFIKERHLYEKKPSFSITEEEISEIKKKLKKKLKRSRYQHTIAVAQTAQCMAMRYGCPMDKAFVAGLLHDCAKGMTVKEQIDYCKEHDIEITPSEKKSPWLLHAKVGAAIASSKFDIKDEEILRAIRYHTTGCPGMSILDKIIFIADYIEPGRTKQVRLPEVRAAAFVDIDLCLKMILSDTIRYLNKGDAHIDETTYKTYEYYK